MTTNTPTRATPATEDRLAAAQLPASAALTALSVATVIALCRVFPDWQYLDSMLFVVVGAHVIAFLLRLARIPLYVAGPLMLLALTELLAISYFRDTLTLGIPTGRTIDLMRINVRLVIDQFPSAVAPVPSVGSFAVATAAAVAACALLADTFAFRAFGRVEAVVPSAVVFVFAAALGTDRHRVAVAALWVAAALLAIAVLRFRQTNQEAAWMGSRRWKLAAALPAIAATVALTGVAAMAIGPRLPGAGEEPLVDARNGGGSVTEVINPLVDIGAQLRNRGNLELFTVSSNDGGHYWRLISLPLFNGRKWIPADETIVEMGDRRGEVALDGSENLATVNIVNLGSNLIPASYHPISVSPDEVYYAPDSQTLVLPDNNTLQAGDAVSVKSIIIHPTPGQLAAATASHPPDSGFLDVPDGLPSSALEAATQVTAGAASPYDKALALQNWFRTQFVYDPNVQLSNSYDAIAEFLREKRGFCQQFAGTFAIMARQLGIPARVAVGFTPGDLGSDGKYHVYGRHAHAWPEVWFDGIGWVAFEPTPGRGNADTATYTGAAAQQQAPDGNPTGNTVVTPTAVPNPNGPTTTFAPVPREGAGGDGGSPSSTTPVPLGAGSGGSSGSSTVPWVIAGLLLAAIAWVVAAPRVIRAMTQRGAHSDSDRVINAWRRTVGTLSLAGAPAVGGLTPLEYADAAERVTGVDHRALRELAVYVTRAVYSPRGVDSKAVSRAELLSEEIDATCRERTPTPMRLKAMIDPRLMRRRLAG